MPTRKETQQRPSRSRPYTDRSRVLGEVISQWRKAGRDIRTGREAARLVGMAPDGAYRDLEAGREVGLDTYERVARKLGLPGGEARIREIWETGKDPGPGEEPAADVIPLARHQGASTPDVQTELALARMEAELARREAELARLQTELVRRDVRIEQLSVEIERRDVEIERLHAQAASEMTRARRAR